MQDIWKLENHCIWSGIVYSDHKGITYGDFYMGRKVVMLSLWLPYKQIVDEIHISWNNCMSSFRYKMTMIKIFTRYYIFHLH